MNQIRAATPDDHDRVAHIWIDGWRSNEITLTSEPTYTELRERIAQEIAGGWQVIVAERKDVVVGFAAISPDKGVLEQIFIDPASHRQGVGAALLARAHALMPGGFTLWTHGENSRAMAFYEAMGMARVSTGTHPKHGHPIVTYGFGALVS